MEVGLSQFLEGNPIESIFDLEDQPGEFLQYWLKLSKTYRVILEYEACQKSKD